MGIESSRIRKAANGGIIIEIPGKDGTAKADELMDKIQEVFKKGNVKAVVKRPTVKGELRVYGFDDSVQAEDIREEISKKGCLEKDIETGPIRGTRNGLCTAWVRCPLATAIQIASEGKLKIGWTVARVELLKARPTQCYRCWQYGYVRGNCTSKEDRSNACFNCGKHGHTMRECSTEPHCVLCKSRGKNPAHRSGSYACETLKDYIQKIQINQRSSRIGGPA